MAVPNRPPGRPPGRSPGSPRPRFVLILVILSSVTLLLAGSQSGGLASGLRNGAQDAFSPIRTFGSFLTTPFSNWWDSVRRHNELRAENEVLRQKLAAIEQEAAKSADVIRERAELLRLLRLENPDNIPRVNARVLGASPSNFEFSIVIDRGTNQGVRDGMPVMAGGGLVGRVLETARSRATVMLLSDPRSGVGVRLSQSGDVGVAYGQGPGKALSVRRIELDTKIQPREVLVTSGLQGSRFPAGLPVGRVERAASPGTGDLERRVTMSPLAELDHLTFVSVLIWNGEPQPGT